MLVYTPQAANSMIVTDLLPLLQSLSRADKLLAIEFLTSELAKEETLSPLKDGQTYEIWSPYDAFEAAHILGKMLDKDKESQDA
ncbi:conserved hypothetical protein [Planktothrix serta PCC 8927]|uniref:Uncharacterized protein n=1 Tax=Planktothrix serta PCC 8927 TaxID=671068 RepID=A0A7Z9BH97_9CYAN|nr:hypothetical protein [Planktothrix serta]VXD11105.1 conserved hypothetical protein [Planktothrix serta PCC 8927]